VGVCEDQRFSREEEKKKERRREEKWRLENNGEDSELRVKKRSGRVTLFETETMI
jgi:hypothetical protein